MGVINFSNDEVLIECIPSDIPAQIEVDISTLTKVGDNIKLKDITAPKGVEFMDDLETTLVSIIIPKENEEEPEEAASLESTEPELVGQKGGEKEESETSTENN